jgi:hypothetical protein
MHARMEKKPKIMLIIRGVMSGVNRPEVSVSEQRFHVLFAQALGETYDESGLSYPVRGDSKCICKYSANGEIAESRI